MNPFRVCEILLFSLVQFLPHFLLTIYPFRNQRRFSRPVTALGIALSTVIHAGMTLWKFYSPRNGLISLGCTVLHALFLIIWYRTHFGKSLFTLLMMTNISNFVIVAAKCLEGLLFPDLAAQMHRWSSTVTIVLVEAVVLMPLFFYYKNVYTKALTQAAPLQVWRYLWLIPLTFYCVWFRNFYFSEEGALTLALRPRYTLFTLVVSGGAMLVYHLVVRLIQESAENAALREREHQLTVQQTQYAALEERIEEARRARHDLRQHLHIISAYLKDKKYDEMEAYICRYHQSQPEDTLQFCDNYAVNALLQYFSGHAKGIGTGFSTAVHLPKEIGIPDEVLSVVLGNLLENAMDACAAQGGIGNVVSVRGKTDDSGVFFKIVNTCPKPPRKDSEGHFLSRKRRGTGIGLRSVENIAAQYGGMMKAHWDDGVFTVSVLLNIPENP